MAIYLKWHMCPCHEPLVAQNTIVQILSVCLVQIPLPNYSQPRAVNFCKCYVRFYRNTFLGYIISIWYSYAVVMVICLDNPVAS